MSRISHYLHTIALISPMLALFGISPAILAKEALPSPWENGPKPPWVGTVITGGKCVGDQQPFGPYDYRDRVKYSVELNMVEKFHFSPNVENRVSGVGSSYLDDIDYTLKTWPNHHRALNSVMRYRLEHRGPWQPDAPQGNAAECYLQRAINFFPTDPVPHMLYGILLHKFNKYDKALASYRKANRLLPNDIITLYNMGLTLVALKNYKEAKKLAKKVYAAGFPLPALKNKLAAVGHWQAGSGAAPPELTESQLARLKKAMREEAARKREKADDVPQQKPAEGESVPVGDERIDPPIVNQ